MVDERIHLYATAAGVDVSAVTDVEDYQARTGRRISEQCWGDADWAGADPLVYVDPAKCATRGRAEVVVAHEVGHHRWKSYRHRPVFWARVQELLDRVSRQEAGPERSGTIEGPQHRGGPPAARMPYQDTALAPGSARACPDGDRRLVLLSDDAR